MQAKYIKEDGKYRRVKPAEDARMYSDGIWLVRNGGKHLSCVLKLGEIPELYPYASMVQDADELASFMFYHELWAVKTTLECEDKSFKYRFSTSAELAQDVLKFLSCSDRDRKEWIDRLKEEAEIFLDTNRYYLTNSKTGRTFRADKKSLLLARKSLEKRMEELDKTLSGYE
jgi:hypothetical protein